MNRLKIKDVTSILNDELGFSLNESDAHDVINYIKFVQGDFYKIVKHKVGDSIYSTMKHGYVHPECDTYGGIKKVRTKCLFTNRWLKADVKLVSDGSIHRDTNYISGWHLFSEYGECIKYLNKFKDKDILTVIRCKACGISKKKHSGHGVWLADEIYIPSNQ